MRAYAGTCSLLAAAALIWRRRAAPPRKIYSHGGAQNYHAGRPTMPAATAAGTGAAGMAAAGTTRWHGPGIVVPAPDDES